MNDRDDLDIDRELRDVARAAAHGHEATVSARETDAALTAVRARIAAGDMGGAPPSIDLSPRPRHRSPLVRLGAAAAVIAMFALGLVVVIGGDAPNDVMTPVTVAVTSPAPTTVAERQPSTTAVETVPVTTMAAPAGFVEQTLVVDAADPPQLLEPIVWQTVPIDAANVERSVSVGVAADTVIVKQKNVQRVSLLGPGPDSPSMLDIDEDVGQIVAGPGPMLYGFGGPVFADDNPTAPQAFRFVAIPFAGPQAGRVVAFEEVDPLRYLELPQDSFGEGPDGVVDRVRDIGTTVIGWVDENGDPLDLAAIADDLGIEYPPVVPRFDDVDGDGVGDVGQRIVIPSNGRAWTLDIRRDPANGSTYSGPSAPRPTTGGRVIFTDRIGPRLGDDDFAPSALPVVGILNPDGSGRWVALPDDWDVVASDIDGTILMRVTESDFEFALLDDALAAAGIGIEESPADLVVVDPAAGDDPVQPSAIARTCVGEGFCTTLASTEDGRIVAFDQVDAMLRIYDSDGTALQSEVPITEPIGSAPVGLVDIGPDDVAYLRMSTPGATDPSDDLLAIALAGPNAGSVVMRWSGLDGSGDSTLIARKAGLTLVGCCGRAVTRPQADATIYRWVDRDGVITDSTRASFDLNLGDAGNTLTRIDTDADGEPTFTPFDLPTAYQYPRDFPYVVATDNGGALAYDYVVPAGVEVLVDFDPADVQRGDSPGALSNGNVYYRPTPEFFDTLLLEPRGTVIVSTGANSGEFARRRLDQVATRGWPGESRTEPTDRGDGLGSTLAPGLNDHIAIEQPFWAGDPYLFALQLKARVGANEQVSVEYDDSDAPVITITTSGFLDDSVEGSRQVIITARADDGLLRFVSGSYGVQCRPGRGHQDYSLALCL